MRRVPERQRYSRRAPPPDSSAKLPTKWCANAEGEALQRPTSARRIFLECARRAPLWDWSARLLPKKVPCTGWSSTRTCRCMARSTASPSFNGFQGFKCPCSGRSSKRTCRRLLLPALIFMVVRVPSAHAQGGARRRPAGARRLLLPTLRALLRDGRGACSAHAHQASQAQARRLFCSTSPMMRLLWDGHSVCTATRAPSPTSAWAPPVLLGYSFDEAALRLALHTCATSPTNACARRAACSA